MMSILSSWVIIGYYAVINTWSLCYMFHSTDDKLKWTTVPDADNFLWNEFLGWNVIFHIFV